MERMVCLDIYRVGDREMHRGEGQCLGIGWVGMGVGAEEGDILALSPLQMARSVTLRVYCLLFFLESVISLFLSFFYLSFHFIILRFFYSLHCFLILDSQFFVFSVSVILVMICHAGFFYFSFFRSPEVRFISVH